MTHPREMQLATQEQSDKYMGEAVEFVTKRTTISDDTVLSLGGKVPEQAVLGIAELVVYMAVYALAEANAQKDGVTLRDWVRADAAYALLELLKEREANFVPADPSRLN